MDNANHTCAQCAHKEVCSKKIVAESSTGILQCENYLPNGCLKGKLMWQNPSEIPAASEDNAQIFLVVVHRAGDQSTLTSSEEHWHHRCGLPLRYTILNWAYGSACDSADNRTDWSDGVLDTLCKAAAERRICEELLRGKCSVCTHYTPRHRQGKCADCHWDIANPACLREYQQDNWELRELLPRANPDIRAESNRPETEGSHA